MCILSVDKFTLFVSYFENFAISFLKIVWLLFNFRAFEMMANASNLSKNSRFVSFVCTIG